MNDNTEKKIEELEEIITSVLKDNEFLKFENVNLIKQNKLNSAIIEKLHQRIDNLTKLKDLPISLSKISNTRNENSLSRNESNQLLNVNKQDQKDDNHERNDDKHERNDDNHERNDNKHERNDNSHERNDNKHERNDSNHKRNESNHERNDNKHESNDSNHKRNDNNHERNESSHERNESSHERNDNSQEHNDISQERNESSHERNDNSQERNESSHERNNNSQERNESSHERNDSSQLNNAGEIIGKTDEKGHNDIISSQFYNIKKIRDKTSPSDSVEKFKKEIIRKNLDDRFKNKFINKVKNRLTEEIYYFSSQEKVRVDALLKTIKISFPAIMRDFQLLKKYNWIEHVGPREGGHYRLTKEGRILTIETEEYQ